MDFLPFLTGPFKGHGAIKDLFLKGHDRGTMGHAYRFSGPQGIGKTTLALRCALSLLTDISLRQAFDGIDKTTDISPQIKRFIKGTHGDLKVLPSIFEETPNSLSVASIREAMASLAHAPMEGDHRVVILRDLSLLTPQASNALLKTLEDPPQKTFFFLIDPQKRRPLDTLLSRCQTCRLSPLTFDETKDILTYHTPAKKSDPTLDVLAFLYPGRPGKTLVLETLFSETLLKNLHDILFGADMPTPTKIMGLHTLAAASEQPARVYEEISIMVLSLMASVTHQKLDREELARNLHPDGGRDSGLWQNLYEYHQKNPDQYGQDYHTLAQKIYDQKDRSYDAQSLAFLALLTLTKVIP